MSSAAVRWLEELGDLGDGGGFGFEARGGPGRLVTGLGRDELERHFLLAKVGGGRVAELVEYPAGMGFEEDANAV